MYFITQNPLDIPDEVLAQLGNRVQHALRAFTPRDQKAVRTAAETLRANPAFDTKAAISELAVGEALVSLLDEKGTPSDRGARVDSAARVAHRSDDRRGAARRDATSPVIRGPLRADGRSRIGVREAHSADDPAHVERGAGTSPVEPAPRVRSPAARAGLVRRQQRLS